VIIFTIFAKQISDIKKNSARWYQTCTQVFMWSTCYSCQILIKLAHSQQIFKKYPNTKFNENLSSGSWVVPCRQTDRQPDTTKLIDVFHHFGNMPKNVRQGDQQQIHIM